MYIVKATEIFKKCSLSFNCANVPRVNEYKCHCVQYSILYKVIYFATWKEATCEFNGHTQLLWSQRVVVRLKQ